MNMTPAGRARLHLAVLGFLAIVALLTGPPPLTPRPVEQSDITTYRAIVARLRSGEPYYAALGAELRPRGYATREVFNWRTPLHFTALSVVSHDVATGALIAVLASMGVGVMAAVRSASRMGRLTAASAFAGLLIFTGFPDIIYMSEIWTGAFIGCSLVAFSLNRSFAGVALGLLALFTRELAAPYCVVCTLLAAARGRWREVAAWMSGAVVYAGYYSWHIGGVLEHRLANELAHAASWVEFGGLPFLLTTLRWWGWLFLVPPAWSVLGLALAAGGVLSRKAPVHVRLAVLAYALWFVVVGKSFDHYWGLIAAPAWTMASAYGAELIETSLKALREPRPQPGPG